MDCIQSSNKAVDKFGAGKHGFNPGNPAASQIATVMTPAWCDGVQEEILNVIRGGGLVPSGADLSQMLQAINILLGARVGGPGEVKTFARTTAPTGWLKCNGAAVSRATYAALFSVIGTTYGAGDGSTTFNLPDLRGEFVRGLDDGRGVDAGRTLAAAQAQQMLQHNHGVTESPHGHAVVDPSHNHAATVTDPTHTHGVTDPTHVHAIQHDSASSTSGAGISGASTTSGATGTTDAAATGVTINAAGTGVTVANTAAATGITLNNAVTGLTVNNSAGGAELRPRNVALLYCISF